jgi:hypothetical protein
MLTGMPPVQSDPPRREEAEAHLLAYFRDWSFHPAHPDERFDLDRAFRHYAPHFHVRDVPPNLEALRQGRWQRDYYGEHGASGYRRPMEVLYGRSRRVDMKPYLDTLRVEPEGQEGVRTLVDFDSRVVFKGPLRIPFTLPLRANVLWRRQEGAVWKIEDEVLSLRWPRLLGR